MNPWYLPPMKGEWHIFGTHNYLGPGTRYSYRRARGVQPMDSLDAVAMDHDALYSATSGPGSHTFGGKVVQNYFRGLGDLWYGGKMIGTDPTHFAGYALAVAGAVRWVAPVALAREAILQGYGA